MKAYILLDKSGSMGANWAETISAVNSYVERLAAEKPKTKVTVAAFDTVSYDVVRDKIRARDYQPIGEREVRPQSMTPLLDSVGRIADAIVNDDPKKASLVIVTDGAENASREVTHEAARAKLDDLRGRGYDVVFIGADFENFGQASGLGNAHGSTMMMTKGSYGDAFNSMATRSLHYAATGSVAEFTDEQRAAASGK